MTVRRIQITTGARLHFGLLSLSETANRKFGGAGVMINQPGVRISIQSAENNQITLSSTVKNASVISRVETVRDILQQTFPDEFGQPCRLQLHETIPSHLGFGSGTQLSLAVALSICCLAGRQLDSATLVKLLNRGQRSAIGVHGFFHGGFLVDGGKDSSTNPAPLVSRVEFPQEWRFLLVSPPLQQGLSGNAEQTAFDTLPQSSLSQTAELCRLLLLELLPAIVNRQFEETSQAFFEFGQRVGQLFQGVQGGCFASPLMAELTEELRTQKIMGTAQTSWGPTIAILCESEESAQQLQQRLSADSRWQQCRFQTAAPRNRGASVEEFIC